ncbi:Sensor histidine kinase YycG [compost metagenome]
MADQEVIFDKFRQVGDTLTQKPKGSGLGLAISRQIIDHFGGRLWVQSRSGEGSTFSFTLPIR